MVRAVIACAAVADRLVTVKNLRWRWGIVTSPFTWAKDHLGDSDGVLCASYIPAGLCSIGIGLVMFLPLLFEALVGIADLGLRIGWARFMGTARPAYEQFVEWYARYNVWSERVVQESIILLVIAILGYILGAAALVVTIVVLFAYGEKRTACPIPVPSLPGCRGSLSARLR